jgi:ERCC4-type nuclease
MVILIDTRENPKAEGYERRCKSFGVPYERKRLLYGDYTYNFTLPNGKPAYEDDTVSGAVVIERKMSLDELSGNLCQEFDRFNREFRRAIDHDASVYLLVEEATWEKIYGHKYNTKFNERAYTKRLLRLAAEYDVKPIFCRRETSGLLIKDILERELKIRLMRGDYDEEVKS